LAASANSPGRGPNLLISGRYRVQAELGRGGMGAVYRVLDEARGRIVALKTIDNNADRRLVGLFEREYHTLASLRHPRVIEVYDFGIAQDGRRYYTMELLAGGDLVTQLPLPFVQAAAHLRDTATSLALLHARRLVHRDVSPRNIRLDAAGRAKLLDFGALTGFGAARELVGTPPFMAPEALRRLALDQRSDLFSLGVVAYYVLTGQLPYAIRNMSDAEEAYRVAPAPPSQLAPDVPAGLDQLVLALLSLDPLGRPSSAAEVIDRLSALAQLDAEPLTGIAESHLLSSALVGREREKAQLKQHVARAKRGLGSVVVLEGPPGMGRSRLASELAIDARIAGVTSLRIDALAHPEPNAALRALAAVLLESAPSEAGEALRAHAAVLALEFDELRARVPESQRASASLPKSRPERRAHLQSAFARWVLATAEQRPLVLVVDDASALDADSAGALVMLGHAAPSSRLLLVLTLQNDSVAPVAVQQLTRLASRLRLPALSGDEVDGLVASVFGDVPHRARLTPWLSAAGRGNPGQSLELLKHLVERGLIRYERGAWALPAELPERELPGGLEEALVERLRQLSAPSLRLLRLFALYRGGLPLRVCLKLLPGQPDVQIVSALDQLVARDFLVRADDTYRFGQPALRTLVLADSTLEERSSLHAALNQALMGMHEAVFAAVRAERASELSTQELVMVLEVATHLELCGEQERGRRLMRDAAVELTMRGDGLAEAVPALAGAVERLKRDGRPAFERLPLLLPLVLAGTYSDFRLSYRYGEEALELLLEYSGIALAQRLKRFVGGRFALGIALSVSALRFWFLLRRRIAASYRDLILGVIGIGSALLGTASVLLDEPRARRVVERTEMLKYFPRHHAVNLVRTLHLALYDAARGDAAGCAQQAMSVLAALSQVRGVREEARLQLQVGCLTPSSLAYGQRIDGRIHEVFETLERLQGSVSRQIAVGARAAYHGHRGERAKFVRYHVEMDMLASRAGSTWREDVGTPRQMWSSYALCEDVMGLKRCAQELDAMADELPSLRPVRDAARACYLSERGLHQDALTEYGAMFERVVGDGTLMGARFAGAYARILRAAGRHERAREVCDQALAALSPEALEYTLAVIGAQLELVLSLAALGRPDEALARLDALQAAHGTHDNPLVHGLVHKARAQIALQMGERELLAQHLAALELWFRRSENPALIAQWQRLTKEAQAAAMLEAQDADAGQVGVIRVALQGCRGPAERLQVLLELVMERTGAERAYLYLCEPEGLRCVAPTLGPMPPEPLRVELSTRLSELSALGASQRAVQTGTIPWNEAHGLTVADAEYLAQLLVIPRDGAALAVGALALVAGAAPLAPLDSAFTASVAAALHEDADVRSSYLEPEESIQTLRARPQPSNENGTS
jgi:tetratricopeptide (TPR) repeat protein